MDELDQALEDKESELLEKAEKYRNQLKAECEMDIANEKQNRRTIMRAQVDREMRQEKEARYAAMEAELRRARAKAWTQMKFEVEEGRSNMAAKMTGKAASESGADGDSENEDDRASENGADKASENGDDGASESGADDGSVNAPTEASENGDDRASVQDGRNTPTESSDDAKSDTSLINESAKSPVSRSRTSRCMYLRSRNHLTTPAVHDTKHADKHRPQLKRHLALFRTALEVYISPISSSPHCSNCT